MITFLEGALVEAFPTHAVVQVGGVGYHVFIPLSSYDKLPTPGTQFKILTHLVVREDAHLLYGFMSTAERDLFRLLVNNVSGIGPRTALDVLSGASVVMFKAAVVANDAKALSRIKGIGKKTAERLIVELRDRVAPLASPSPADQSRATIGEGAPSAKRDDLVSALVNLGYQRTAAERAIATAFLEEPDATFEAALKSALRLLSR